MDMDYTFSPFKCLLLLVLGTQKCPLWGANQAADPAWRCPSLRPSISWRSRILIRMDSCPSSWAKVAVEKLHFFRACCVPNNVLFLKIFGKKTSKFWKKKLTGKQKHGKKTQWTTSWTILDTICDTPMWHNHGPLWKTLRAEFEAKDFPADFAKVDTNKACD